MGPELCPIFISNISNLFLLSIFLSQARGLLILLIFSKNQLLVSLTFLLNSYFQLCWLLLEFLPIFLLSSDLLCSSFSSFLRRKLKVIDFRSSFLTYIFNTTNFPLSTAFTTSHNFDKLCFHFQLKYFQISLEGSSLTHVIYKCVVQSS